MKRILLSLIVTAALFFGMVGAQPARAQDTLGAVTLSATGWSDPLAGDWDPATGLATLKANVAGLTIEADIAPSVVVQGNGHFVIGTGTGNGIYTTGWTAGHQLTVKDLVISGFARGVAIGSSTGVTLDGISASNCDYGVYLLNSSGNTLTGCTADSNDFDGFYVSGGSSNTFTANSASSNTDNGLHLTLTTGNVLTGNTLSSNGKHGLYIETSSKSSLSGNVMAGNRYNFRLEGFAADHYDQMIDATNMVDGKPILYVKGATGGTYDASSGSWGTVYLVKCDGVTVRGLTLSGNYSGVHLWDTTNSIIEDNQTTGNAFGIYLHESSNNATRGNTVSTSGIYGLYVSGGSDNLVYGNQCLSNPTGICLDNSIRNTVQGNTVSTSGSYGLYVSGANDNLVYGNQFLSNSTQAYVYTGTGNLFNRSAAEGGGNYWDDWTGPDADGDGFVDSPYVFHGGQDDLPLADVSDDVTPPETTHSLAGEAGENDWYVSDVTVTLTATDSGSGVSYTKYSFDNASWTTYQGPFDVNTEGTKTLYYYSVDNAGNEEPVKGPVEFKIDQTAPTLAQTAVTGEAGENGWYVSDVTVAFSAADAVSGLADPADATFELTTSGEGMAVSTGTYTVRDQAGNVAVAGPLTFQIDQTPPVVTGTPTTSPNAAGWYNADVTVAFTATDAVSGLADPADAAFELTASGEGTAVSTGTHEVCDLAGNSAVAGPLTFKIDQTPPTVSIVTPDPYEVVTFGTGLYFGATDALSGVASVTGLLDNGETTVSVASGYTPGVGVYTLEVTATDRTDNVATATVEFVVYDPYSGFVTGGGWFTSAPGAYPQDPTLTGTVSFGFVSKYDKSLSPNGQTEFHFKAAGMDFHSTTYDSLVVSGTKATFKGTGTINGSGSYSFVIVAIDGAPDCLRVKISDTATGLMVYDTGQGADETSGPTTAIDGGSIAVKKG